jgi:hypothetical protein
MGRANFLFYQHNKARGKMTDTQNKARGKMTDTQIAHKAILALIDNALDEYEDAKQELGWKSITNRQPTNGWRFGDMIH